MTWNKIKDRPRNEQKTVVANTVRVFLSARFNTLPPLSTRELAQIIDPDDPYEIIKILSALAPHLEREGFVEKGEEFVKFGKVKFRNNWVGKLPRSGLPAPQTDATNSILPPPEQPMKKKSVAEMMAERKALLSHKQKGDPAPIK